MRTGHLNRNGDPDKWTKTYPHARSMAVTFKSDFKHQVFRYRGRIIGVAAALMALMAATLAAAQDIGVGEGIALQWAQFFVADHYNTWKDEGLTAKSTLFASGRLVMDATLGGGVLLGTTAETPIMFAAMNGLPVRIVATLNAFEPFDVVAINDIKSGKDLKGRRIGYAQGTNGHYYYSKILDSVGLSPSDVKSVNLSPADFVSSLANGSIDAFVWTEPYISQAMSMGEGRFHVLQFPNLYIGYSAVITLQNTLDKDPQTVVKALKALLAADRIMAKDPGTAADITADRIKLDPKIAHDYWPRAKFGMALNKEDLVKELQAQAKWAIANKLVAPDATIPDFDKVVVTQPFVEAQGK